jgi:hypothetical protein
MQFFIKDQNVRIIYIYEICIQLKIRVNERQFWERNFKVHITERFVFKLELQSVNLILLF